MDKYLFTAFFYFVLCLMAIACNQTGFTGSSSPAKKTAPAVTTPPVNKNAANSTPQGDSSGFVNNTETATSTGTDYQPTKPPTTQEQCLRQKADNYNIVMVIDSSRSLQNNDPSNVRQTAALSFVDKFISYTTTYPDVAVRLAIVAFAGSAAIGQNGWIPLTSQYRPMLEADIGWATNFPQDIGQGTSFYDGLNSADYAFNYATNSTAGRIRNYVVFFTDGQDKGPDVSGIISQLVNNRKVAILAIVMGQDALGSQVAYNMAQPKTNPTEPDHIGQYYEAQSAADLESVWITLFTNMAQCL